MIQFLKDAVFARDLRFTVGKLDLKPGDMVVVKFPGKLTADGVDALQRGLKEIFPDHRAIVLENGADIDVISSVKEKQ